MLPPQMSVAVNVSAVGTALHSNVPSAGKASTKLGGVVSSITNVAMVCVAFWQESVAVNTTWTALVFPHVMPMVVKSLLHFKPEHSSVAVAPAFALSQAIIAAVLPAPSHSTVSFSAGVTRTGAVTSSIFQMAVVVEKLPHSSVAVKVTSAESPAQVEPIT